MGPNSPYILIRRKWDKKNYLYNVETKEVITLDNDQNFQIRTERIIPADYIRGKEEYTFIDDRGVVFNNNGNIVFIKPNGMGAKIYEEGKNVKKIVFSNLADRYQGLTCHGLIYAISKIMSSFLYLSVI